MLAPLRQLAQEEFPSRLKEIPDPPSTLFIRGTLPPEDSHMLCVVGSRKSTPYGRDACSALIQGLSGRNIVIISGLALGTDALAHQSALDAGLTTIAVPGSGLGENVLYPRTNFALAERILEAGGALISEFPEEFRARPESFPRRNRIMAGLSQAVLIIEAEIRSGTLITSRLATEYNRDVLTVPGSIFSSTSAGPHLLMRLGATPVRSGSDILEALGIDEKEDKPPFDFDSLSEEEQKVMKLISSPLSRDELIEKLALPIQKANVLLSALELQGLIVEKMGTLRQNI